MYDVTPPVLRLWRGGWNGYYLIAFLNPPPHPHTPHSVQSFSILFPSFPSMLRASPPPLIPVLLNALFSLCSLQYPFFFSLYSILFFNFFLPPFLLYTSPFFLLHTSYSNPPSFDTSHLLFLFPSPLPFRLLSLHSFFFPAPFLSPHFQSFFSFCHYTAPSHSRSQLSATLLLYF